MSDRGEAAAYGIRAVRRDDAPGVLAAFESAPDMDRQGDVTDLASAEQYVAWLCELTRVSVAIDLDGLLVGLVAVTVDQANRSGWVFYWLHADHRGRGLMARAVTTVCNDLLHPDRGQEMSSPETPVAGKLDRLELGHRVNNPESGAVARAAGFVQEGRERGKFLIDGERIDVLTYARLTTDPWPTTEPLPASQHHSTPRC
ncbi:GNAT family N-acetyltransferase [Ornithinimicrobium sp. Y1847]|uniref:GNAT family N-acetyltransferase n=1 Tax=Ornithinimicrobium sp. Y1847 TaxID=3405419 RepID=UPI003B67E7EA